MRAVLQTTKPTDDDGCIHREPGATGEREAKRGRTGARPRSERSRGLFQS